MNYYQELTIIPQGEDISPYFIWSKLYTQLHIAFVEHKDNNDQVPYGVSFPQYRVDHKGDKTFMTLGTKLRVFAHNESELEQLNLAKQLERLSDYVHISSIKAVPDKVAHLHVMRDRKKAFCPKRNKAYADRRGISEKEAKAHFMKTSQRLPLPFIQLKSETNNQLFTLNINQKPADKLETGAFNTYGLSRTSTVPHW